MKKVYIPAGETVCYDTLHTDILVVKGCLNVRGKLTTKSIQGKGMIEADEIICDTADVNSVTARLFTAQKIAARKLFVTECRAAVIAVTDFIEAVTVHAEQLTMTLSSISNCEAGEIIVLPQKKRRLLGMLLMSWWRSFLLSRSTAPKKQAKKSPRLKPQQPVEPEPISEQQLDAILAALKKRGYQMEDIHAPENGVWVA